MSTLVYIIVVLAVAHTLGESAANPVALADDSPMLQVLDSMEQIMTGGSEYDRVFYDNIRSCMATFDSKLIESQDSAWQGIIDYWTSNGTGVDYWGSYMTQYLEQNATVSNLLGMIIYEPCNYASNLAYYHDATEFCAKRDQGSPWALSQDYVNALGKSFSALAMGSSFMHMSHTELGHLLDNLSIGVISYLIHQGSFSALSDVPPILTDLQPTPRKNTSLEIADDFLEMYANMSVYEWYDHAKALDIPDYYLSFAGIFCTVLTFGFEDEFVDTWLPILAGAFDLPPEIYDFITLEYLPEIRNLSSNVDLGLIEHTRFLKDAIGTTAKLIYAFLWQEERLTDNPIFLNETVNMRGWELLPSINTKLNNANSFDYYEVDFQNGTNIYPGDTWCNPVMPHAKWHLQAGIGLLDLVYLGDEIYNIFASST